MSRFEAGCSPAKEIEPRLHEDFEPAALARGFRDLLMRVTDTFEVEFPGRLGAIGEALGLTGDAVDLAAGRADPFDDAASYVAP